MKRTLILTGISFVILLTGCGKLSSSRLTKVLTGKGDGFGFPDSKAIILDPASEVPAAIRICTALKQKRMDLEKRIQAGEKISYNFKLEKRNCTNGLDEKVQNIITAILFASNALEYDNENPSYLNNVITDNIVALTATCKLALDTTNPHTNISNVIPVDANTQYNIGFSTINNVDSFYYKVRTKDASGSFTVTSGDSIIIDTTVTSKSYGVEKERSHLIPCSIAGQATTAKETWVSSLTPN